MPALHRKIASLLQEFTRKAEIGADADLLARFARSQDETAFAALVERHGPMVFSVCRRVLGDAEQHPKQIRQPSAASIAAAPSEPIGKSFAFPTLCRSGT